MTEASEQLIQSARSNISHPNLCSMRILRGGVAH